MQRSPRSGRSWLSVGPAAGPPPARWSISRATPRLRGPVTAFGESRNGRLRELVADVATRLARETSVTDPTDSPDTSAAFAHASFMVNPDLVAEREIWRDVTEELSRRFDAAQLLRPGAALASELRALV